MVMVAAIALLEQLAVLALLEQLAPLAESVLHLQHVVAARRFPMRMQARSTTPKFLIESSYVDRTSRIKFKNHAVQMKLKSDLYSHAPPSPPSNGPTTGIHA